MRFRVFNARYRLLAPNCRLRKGEEPVCEDTAVILNCLPLTPEQTQGPAPSWAFGKRHIFLRYKIYFGYLFKSMCWVLIKMCLYSEGARQQLETLRTNKRHNAAARIQATWRGWSSRRRWPALRRSLTLQHGGTSAVTTLPSAIGKIIAS